MTEPIDDPAARRAELRGLFLEMIAASDEVTAAFAARNMSRREAVARLDRGEDLRSILDADPVAPKLERTRAAMTHLDVTRGRIRSAIMRACLDEGMTKREIAERWGVSAQLVSKYTTDGLARRRRTNGGAPPD